MARMPCVALVSAAVDLLAWARWPLRLPYLPVKEAIAIRCAGDEIAGAIRWAMTPPDPDGERVASPDRG